MRKANKKELKRVLEYFKSYGHDLDTDNKYLVSDNIEDVVKYFGYDPSNMSYEEMENAIDIRFVWFDGEESCLYYVLV